MRWPESCMEVSMCVCWSKAQLCADLLLVVSSAEKNTALSLPSALDPRACLGTLSLSLCARHTAKHRAHRADASYNINTCL